MSGSFLDMLRQRTAAALQDEGLRRASDFGAGMLASGSPNFFTMLGAGARAQAEGERSRMEELRRVAEAERQQRALDIEETRRQEELRLREASLAAEAPLRAAQARQAEAMARFYSQGGSGAGRGQLTPAALAQIYQRAQAQALRDFPDPAAGMPESEVARAERLRRRAQRAEELIAGALETARATPGTAVGTPATPAAPAPAAVIDLRTNPGGNPSR